MPLLRPPLSPHKGPQGPKGAPKLSSWGIRRSRCLLQWKFPILTNDTKYRELLEPNMRFRKPPLVEVVAELRWGLAAASASPPTPALPTEQDEQLFADFATQMESGTSVIIERLQPKAFPVFPHQVCCRYKIPGQPDGYVYQLGPKVFTANAKAPNYESWAVFAPVVADGIDLLLRALPKSADDFLFASARLGYIDLFKKQRFYPDKTGAAFMKDALRLHVQMPDATLRRIGTGGPSAIALAYQAPLEALRDGLLEVQVQEGSINSAANEPGLILHTAISITRNIPGTKEAVMAVLEEAHTVIHECFLDMTQSLHGEMEQVDAD